MKKLNIHGLLMNIDAVNDCFDIPFGEYSIIYESA